MNLEQARTMVEKSADGNPASDTALAVVLVELVSRVEKLEVQVADLDARVQGLEGAGTAKAAEVPKPRRR